MRIRPLGPGLFVALMLSTPWHAFAQVPVKVFTSSSGQTDKGTALLVAAVRKRLAEMPRYKIWQGGPSEFPKTGVLVDIQGIDVLAGEDEVVGSAVLVTCSMPAPHDAGYERVLYRKLMEVVPGDKDVDDDATEMLAELDRRVPAAPTTSPSKKSAASKPKHPSRSGK